MMRIIKYSLVGLVLLLVSISCQKELDGVDSIGPGTGNNNDTTNCKSCNYFPFCDSTTYTYIDTTAGGFSVVTQTLELLGDTTVDGTVFHKASTGPGTAFSYENCNTGVTTLFAFPQPGNRLTTTVLRVNEPVGTTWTDANMNAGTPFNYKWTIIAKDLNKIVLNVPYSNVIQVHLQVNADVAGTTMVFAESDYFYAPNVGLIDNLTFDTTSGQPVLALHRVLQSFHIP